MTSFLAHKTFEYKYLLLIINSGIIEARILNNLERDSDKYLLPPNVSGFVFCQPELIKLNSNHSCDSKHEAIQLIMNYDMV